MTFPSPPRAQMACSDPLCCCGRSSSGCPRHQEAVRPSRPPRSPSVTLGRLPERCRPGGRGFSVGCGTRAPSVAVTGWRRGPGRRARIGSRGTRDVDAWRGLEATEGMTRPGRRGPGRHGRQGVGPIWLGQKARAGRVQATAVLPTVVAGGDAWIARSDRPGRRRGGTSGRHHRPRRSLRPGRRVTKPAARAPTTKTASASRGAHTSANDDSQSRPPDPRRHHQFQPVPRWCDIA